MSEHRRIFVMLKVLLEEKNVSMYKLEQKSKISHATMSDLCNEKTKAENCSSSLIHSIASALDMSMDELYMILTYQDLSLLAFNDSFDLFKSNICHELKDLDYLSFLKKYLSNNYVLELFKENKLPEALYLLSLIDYLCIKNNLPVPVEYQDVRNKKLDKLYVSKSNYLLLKSRLIKITDLFKESMDIFLSHNILEAEIENV